MQKESKDRSYVTPELEQRGDAVQNTASVVSVRTPKEGATMLWAPNGE